MAEVKYMGIVHELRQQIDDGLLKPGDMLPSENALCEKYSISRMSVRKGLAILAERGYIFSMSGKGHFVSTPKIDEFTLYFNEEKFVKEYVERIDLRDVSIITPDEVITAKLKLGPRIKVISILRILHSASEPVAYDVKYIPYEKGKPLVEEELHYATFPEIVEKKASLFSVKKELSFWSESASSDAQDYLGLDAQHPVTNIEQLCINSDGKPIIWGKITIPSEYIRLKAVSTLSSRFDV